MGYFPPCTGNFQLHYHLIEVVGALISVIPTNNTILKTFKLYDAMSKD